MRKNTMKKFQLAGVILTLVLFTAINVYIYWNDFLWTIKIPGFGPSQEEVHIRFNLTGCKGVLKKIYTENTWNNKSIEQFIRQHTQKRDTNSICQKGYVQMKLNKTLPTSFHPSEHMFLNSQYKTWKYPGNPLEELPLPFGLKNQGKLGMTYQEDPVKKVDQLLKLLPNADKPDRFGTGCKRCVVVGSSGNLLRSKLGKEIDSHDIVIRMTSSPTKGFEEDVGSRTSLRFLYPEGAMRNPEGYTADEDVVLIAFKMPDLHWLESLLRNQTPNLNQEGLVPYWKEPPLAMNVSASHVRLLNPYIVLLSSYEHIFVRKSASSGVIALVAAMYYCDHIDIAGFSGYDDATDLVPIHYYEPDYKKSYVLHEFNVEKLYILGLLEKGVIGRDLSGYYYQALRKKAQPGWQEETLQSYAGNLECV